MKRLAVPALLAVALVPVLAGLGGFAGLDAGAFRELGATPGLGRAVALSLWTGVAATTLSLLFAHLTLALAGTGGWLGRLRAGALPLLALPHLAVAIGLALVIAPSGLLLRLISPWLTGFAQPPDWSTIQDPAGLALIAGLVVKETPFLLLALIAALAQVPAGRLVTQARVLGYGRVKAWLVAVAPLLQRQIGLPLAAVLVYGMSNVEMALPLAPRTPPPLALFLWQGFTSADPARRAAAFAGALLLALLCLGSLAAGALLTRGFLPLWRAFAGNGRRGRHAVLPVAAASGPAVAAALGLLAALALAVRSLGGPWPFPRLLPVRFDATAWWSAATDLPAVAGTTVAVAAATTLIAVTLVLAAAEAVCDRPRARQWISLLLFVPLLLPQLAFLFGLQVIIVRLNLDGSLAAVIWSHLVFALPYAWGVIAPARASLDPRFSVVARLLRAGAARRWLTVTLPLLGRVTLLALALGFAVSVAVYLPTLFSGAGRVATLATAAAAATAAGDARFAAAYAAAQALLPLAAFAAATAGAALIFRQRRGVPGA